MRRLSALVVVVLAGVGGFAAAAGAAPGSFTTRGAWSFASAPRLHPPKLLTVGHVSWRRLAPGDFLLANFPNLAARGPMTGQSGPLLVDQTLAPVWFASVPTNVVAADLQQETYLGQPVLVWWEGQLTDTGGTLRGEVVVVDQDYRRRATLRARRPWVISQHDAVISGGDIWVTVYRYVRNQNLTAYGGPRRGTVYDAGVQEYELATGKLLYTWDALNPGRAPHIPLAASEQPASVATAPGAAWDAYHLNSIQVLPSNRILVSMRNTWAAYLIDTTTGKIDWTLGGKHSSFKFARGASFAWQHHVQFVSATELTLFDDACCRLEPRHRLGPTSGTSRGVVLRLDLVRRTASLLAAFPHRPPLAVLFLGSMQLRPNHGALVGWGSLPYFSEYSRRGAQLLDVRFPGKDQSYRALFTSSWVGTPSYPPHGAVRHTGARETVYASWNGATEVSRWEIMAGSSPHDLRVIAAGRRRGFETAFAVRAGSGGYFAVRALSSGGQVLGTSRAFR